MLGAVIQAQLLGVLRTGDPMVDALLTTLLVTVVSAATMHKAAIVAWLKRLWFASAVEQGSSSITISFVDGSCYSGVHVNHYYSVLMWYLTFKIPTPPDGEATLFKREEGAETFVMTNKRAVVFDGHEVTLQSTHDTDKDGHVVRKRIVVAAKGKVMPLIREFVKEIHRQHTDHIKNTLWSQKMFHMKVNTGEWIPQSTHSTKTFDTIVLQTDVKKRIVADFRGFLSAEKWYADIALPYKRGYLFHGPPGTGKTSMVIAMSNESKRNIYRLDLSKMGSDDDLDRAFASMPSNCVVVLEDVDCASAVTHARGSSSTSSRALSSASSSASSCASFLKGPSKDTFTLSALLNHLDGIGSNHGRVFVMTSNHPELLDPALVRPGRVDMSVYLGRCCADQVRQFYELYFQSFDDEDTHKLRLDDVRPDVLTPAEVASVLQHHRNDPRAAVDELVRISVQAGGQGGWFSPSPEGSPAHPLCAY